MKVALVSPLFLPFQGGMSTYTDNLAKYLVKNGIEVTVISSNFFKSNEEYQHFRETKNYDIKLLPVIKFLKDSYLNISLFNILAKNTFDLVHLQILYPFGTEQTLLAKLINKKPVVATLHTFRTDIYPVTKMYENAVQNKLIKYLNLLIVTTYYFKRQVKLLTNVDSTVIPVGISDAFWDNNIQPFSKFSPYILFVGGLRSSQPHKNIEFLLKVFQNFTLTNPRYHLVIIGDGDEKLKYQLMSKEMYIDNKVHFLGEVDNSLLPSYYKGANCFFFPSSKETFGMPLIEALSQNTSILAQYLPIYKELYANSKGIHFYKTDNIKSVSNYLENIIKKNEYMKENNQFSTLKDIYSWDGISKRILKCYKKLLFAGETTVLT